MSKIKNINIQLDPEKKREKKIIDLLDKLKSEDGISYKEAVINALEDHNSEVLKLLSEIKQLILFSNPSKQGKESESPRSIRKIAASDDDISKEDINF